MSIAGAIDLGTTRIKAAVLRDDGSLETVADLPAPAITGPGLRRESDPAAYREAATAALDALRSRAGTEPAIGLASQRSSFVLWDAGSGAPVTPLISWQDRRAAAWCEARRRDEPWVARLTGLRLSPHYAGPKLAVLRESSPELAAGLGDGTLRFGTLESFLLWGWTGGTCHETDPTMAARTLLFDIGAGDWSAALLELFGVPPACLPRIVPTLGRGTAMAGGGRLEVGIADQAASALAVLGTGPAGTTVTLGTGGFVLRPTGRGPTDHGPTDHGPTDHGPTGHRPTGHRPRARPGYLAGPLLATSRATWFAVEGTINGAAAAVDRYGPGPTRLPRRDPAPEAFCLPDAAGVGAPHWIPGRGMAFSPAARRLGTENRRRVVLEGVVFRVREILEGLGDAGGRLHLAGGLARDPFVAPALAACLGREVHRLEEAETTLLGAARLAAGLTDRGSIPATACRPGAAGGYLAPKFARWSSWLRTELGG
ncbi:MAG: FGGY family carbohydrate kinase [Acidobacteriota bacterium]